MALDNDDLAAVREEIDEAIDDALGDFRNLDFEVEHLRRDLDRLARFLWQRLGAERQV